jgi:hypothetical protein
MELRVRGGLREPAMKESGVRAEDGSVAGKKLDE